MMPLHRATAVVLVPVLALLRGSGAAFAFSPKATIISSSSSIHSSTTVPLLAKPKRGSAVDKYQTVSVNCQKCGQRLFRYKKKNGTKSNLVKMYMERIQEDCTGLLAASEENKQNDRMEGVGSLACPSCDTHFCRPARIHGRPALKLIGSKIRMTKK